MEFYETVEKRKSIRKYRETPIDDDTMLARILKAVELSPSAKNLQPYNLIIVRDKEKIQELAGTTRNMTFIGEAPMVIAIVADPARAYGWIGGKDSSFWIDSAIAMEHLVLAAASEGLGTCWIGAFDEDAAKSVLKVPEHLRIVGMTPLGVSAQEPERKPRKGFKELLFFEEWGRVNE